MSESRRADAMCSPEDESFLCWARDHFQSVAGEDGVIKKEGFKKALDDKKSFLADRFFTLLDKDKTGSIHLNELIEGLGGLCKCSQEEKLKFLFELFNTKGSETLEYDELFEALRVCVEENAVFLNREQIEELTEMLIDEIDIDGDGEISFTELLTTLRDNCPDVLDNLSLSVFKCLKQPASRTEAKIQYSCACNVSENSFRNNQSLIVTLGIYFLINVGLFTLSAIRSRNTNAFLIVANGCAVALNFNCAIVVVFVLRYTLTWVRSSRLGMYLPIDHSVCLHKLVGRVIAILAAVHTVGHVGNVALVVDPLVQIDSVTNTTSPLDFGNKTREYFLHLFTLRSGIGWVTPGLAYPIGWALDIILLVMVICSMPFVRRRGNFQVFYWTHMLYIIFWALLILHGHSFWYSFIVPGVVFIIEKIYDSPLARLAKFGRTYVVSAKLLPSKVTHLVIARPSYFDYKPGDYIFLKIPEIAAHEWHPFTISSAPEKKDAIWLHIRKAGNWTGKLYDYLENKGKTVQLDYLNDLELGLGDVSMAGSEQALVRTDTHLMQVNNRASKRRSKLGRSTKKSVYKRKSKVVDFDMMKLRVEIGGPYGSPSRDIFETEHAVLIASGIGVTPFASILQSIMYRQVSTRKTCPECQHEWYDGTSEKKLLKVDFIWINRNQQSFEWFLDLLAALETLQLEAGMKHFLDIHLYLTGLASPDDVKGMWLQLAVDAMHTRRHKDAITGLKTRTSPGRPQWDQVFREIDNNKQGKVKVFFCGPAALAKTLKQTSGDFNFGFTQEVF